MAWSETSASLSLAGTPSPEEGDRKSRGATRGTGLDAVGHAFLRRRCCVMRVIMTLVRARDASAVMRRLIHQRNFQERDRRSGSWSTLSNCDSRSREKAGNPVVVSLCSTFALLASRKQAGHSSASLPPSLPASLPPSLSCVRVPDAKGARRVPSANRCLSFPVFPPSSLVFPSCVSCDFLFQESQKIPRCIRE